MSLINNLDTFEHPTSNVLYYANEDKRNMWMYYLHSHEELYMFDPVFPTYTTITLVDKIKFKVLYIVLTANQRNKKQNIIRWHKLFPQLKLIAPDYTYLVDETVVRSNTILPFNDVIHILSVFSSGFHSLCVRAHNYLFVGELLQQVLLTKEQLQIPETQRQFFADLSDDMILLPSFGPIDLLQSYRELQNYKTLQHSPV